MRRELQSTNTLKGGDIIALPFTFKRWREPACARLIVMAPLCFAPFHVQQQDGYIVLQSFDCSNAWACPSRLFVHLRRYAANRPY